MMSDKTRSEEDCNGDIMTGIGLSHETLPTLREGSWAQMIHILHYMVHKLQSPKCVPQINRSFWLAPRVIVSLRPGCESAQKWPLVQMLVVVEKREPGLLIYLTLFFHPVLAFFFSKMSTGVDGDCSERGCSISDILFTFPPLSSFLFYFSKMATSLHFFYPCSTFFLLLKNGYWCRWWLWGRGMQRWWSSRPQRKQNPRQAERAHQNPSCLLYKLYIYAQIMPKLSAH